MRKKMNSKITVEESSGNIFTDLDISQPDEYLMKADLAFQINKLIKDRELNQTEAAQLLKLDQPKISALNRGMLTGFSVERLFKLLAALDQDIEIVISPHRRRRKHAARHIHVRYTAA